MINTHNSLLEDLDANEYFVLCHITKRLNKGNTAFPSKHTLQNETKLSREKLSEAILGLQNKKIITVDQDRKGGKFSKTVYTVITDKIGVYVSAKNTSISQESNDSHRDTENRSTENRDTEKPLTGNPTTKYCTVKEVLLNRSITSLKQEGREEIYVLIVDSFHKHFCAQSEKIKGKGRISKNLRDAKFHTWYDDARLIVTSDQNTLDEIRQVYNFLALKDNNERTKFWNEAISSMSGVRKHFEKLLIDAKKVKSDPKLQPEKKQVYTGPLRPKKS